MHIKNFSAASGCSLLAHIGYIALTALLFLITGLLEIPCNRDGIYVVFFLVSVLGLLLHPLFSYGFSITSIVCSSIALRKGERKAINIPLIVLCALIILATTAAHAWFWWFCILNGA